MLAYSTRGGGRHTVVAFTVQYISDVYIEHIQWRSKKVKTKENVVFDIKYLT